MQKYVAKATIAIGTLASVVTIVSFVSSNFQNASEPTIDDPVSINQSLADDYAFSFKNESSSVVWIIDHSNSFKKHEDSSSSFRDAIPFLEANAKRGNFKLQPGQIVEMKYDFGSERFRRFMFTNFRMKAETCYCFENSKDCWVKSQRLALMPSNRELTSEKVLSCSKNKSS